MLKDRDFLFSQKAAGVVYCYTEYNEIFANHNIENITFHYGMPTEENVNEWIDKFKGKFFVLVLDDMMISLANSDLIIALSTRIVHHSNMCLICITQNIFYQGKGARTTSLNSQGFILSRSTRDRAQISKFFSQLFPGKAKQVMDIYSDAVDNTHLNDSELKYVYINCHPLTAKYGCQIFTQIFENEGDLIMYKV